MTATTWRHSRALASAGLQLAILMSAALALAQCSAVPLASATQPPPPANYGALVATTLRGIKGFAGFSDFQISGLRWAHSASGWNWLACVRFADRGRQHFYTLFLDAGGVISSRYDVRTDQCAAQQYAPLDLATGAIAAPLMTQPQTGGAAPPPSFTLQQPIY
ncbi:MAG: hypothetical protein WB624_26100 [Xanthobacteraceae bacterium]|jgi:hypothetical protein|nr:hypothetical protein [Xanthobacteraceae bacterium]